MSIKLVTFAASYHDILSVRKNRKKIGDTHIVQINDLRIIYSLKQNQINIMSEEFDDTRHCYEGKVADCSLDHALIAASHGIRHVWIGNSRYHVNIMVNHPDGEYLTTREGDATKIHQRKGKIFIEIDGTYLNADADIEDLKTRYIDRGCAMLMPNYYLFRVESGNGFKYYPLVQTYVYPTVSAMANKGTTEEFWIKHKDYL